MKRELRMCAALVAAVAVALPAVGCGGSEETATTDAEAPGAATTGAATTATPGTVTTASGVPLGPPLGSMTQLPGVLTTRPPWPANADRLEQRLQAIGLDALAEEGQALHIHQHLDVFVEGRRVRVPADIGVGPSLSYIAAVHTHEAGVIHVESPTIQTYTLGQFFAIWGVRLDRRCIGGLCAAGGKRLRVWVNGKPVDADPTRIVLQEHQQIVLAFGTPAQDPDPVPASFDFEALGL
ncbi:MAG TPA: hypothetical protein VM299_00020 [Solirubrobacteraceae bacterium]|jgi:hypothetical protein|nr:hypothetical protein [Solirubrobacteraceae bacterium]